MKSGLPLNGPLTPSSFSYNHTDFLTAAAANIGKQLVDPGHSVLSTQYGVQRLGYGCFHRNSKHLCDRLFATQIAAVYCSSLAHQTAQRSAVHLSTACLWCQAVCEWCKPTIGRMAVHPLFLHPDCRALHNPRDNTTLGCVPFRLAPACERAPGCGSGNALSVECR